MSLTGVAKETLAIVEKGEYRAPSGAVVTLRDAIDAAVRGTVLYGPVQVQQLEVARTDRASPPRVEVTAETTARAARRLLHDDGVPDVVLLNFASAKHPGGGFLTGARAQEEDLARASALYPCLLAQRAFYDRNREQPSALYTDHVIHSPKVPFFRDEDLRLIDAPFFPSVITAPAPNAGEHLRRDPGAVAAVRSTLHARAGYVLAVAAAHGHRALVLGAWGCGVFRNEPVDVAAAFASWLEDERLRGAFDRVTFAVYDRSPQRANLRAFRERFGG
jgi:uncharacterized protein (TIGR02452 family)